MYPRVNEWKSEFSKKRYSGIAKNTSNFRPINKNIGTCSANDPKVQQRHYKHYVPAGMFANAKSSVPQIPNVHESSSSSHRSVVPKLYSTSPPTASKISNGPSPSSSKTWDFSDIAPIKKQTRTSIHLPPSPKRFNSEEEVSQDKTPAMKLQPVVPWLKKTNSEDESMLKIENSPDRVESTSGFEKAVARFSDRLDRTGAIPTLSLQNHTDTTIGTVEKALLAVALAKQNSGIPHETLPVFDLLVERSDWLLYREEFNDETDYPPINPFYSHDIVSSDFEEYEQDQEAAFDPSYSDMVKKEIREYDHEDGKDVQKCTLDFLNEPGNLDSQEDFFSGEIPSTLSPPGNFSLFEFSCPSPKNLKATKRSFDHCPLTPEGPSTSKKIHYSSNPLENVPSISTSSDYSPFNYSFLSSSNSPPNSSPGSSKYSFW